MKPQPGQIIHQIEQIYQRTDRMLFKNSEITTFPGPGWKCLFGESWAEVKDPDKLLSQFNRRKMVTRDEQGKELSIFLFDGRYMWYYRPDIKRAHPWDLFGGMQKEEAEQGVLTDQQEFNYWLNQKGAKLLGEERVGKFQTWVVEVTTYSKYCPPPKSK